LETQKGEEPGNTSVLGWSSQTWSHAGRLARMVAVCEWGVLSGIVLRGGESPLQGEGPDGSTRPAKETHAGHVGSDQHEPTSLRGLATWGFAGASDEPRGCEYNRGTGCGKTARPGLCGAPGNGRSYRAIAPGEARRLLRGGSPRRERVSHPPVSSVGFIEEWGNPRTIDEVSVHRESCRP